MMMPLIEIDESSGFCFGVVNAIKAAEQELEGSSDTLYCLGDIVHNSEEVSRLESKGLRTINYDDLNNLSHCKVLLRAHGEPPHVYALAQEKGIEIKDATCPVVLALQKKIRNKYNSSREENAQIVIYGQKGHAEVNGLIGQCNGDAIVIEKVEEVEEYIDPKRPVILFSQTTKSLDLYEAVGKAIRKHLQKECNFHQFDTICRQVSNRIPHIGEFASAHELVFFVAGRKSSNGKVLFSHCKTANPRSIFLSSANELELSMLDPLPKSIGICGATSTPKRQMEELEQRLRNIFNDEKA